MLDACAPKAKWADVFCDRGAFDVDEARAILSRAASVGLGLRVHGNQLGETGGVALAVETRRRERRSLHVSSVTTTSNVFAVGDGGDAPAGSGLLDEGRLLVGATPPRRWRGRRVGDRLQSGHVVRDEHGLRPRDRGARYAHELSTRRCGAATRGGAMALRRDDIGHLGVGAKPDVVILDAPRAVHLAYRTGAHHSCARYLRRRPLAVRVGSRTIKAEVMMTGGHLVIRPLAESDWDRVFEIFRCDRCRR